MAVIPTPVAFPVSSAALRPPSVVTLAWRQLRRDLRAGELRLLVVAVTLAVAALTAVGFFADRLNGGLARDARALLGGDAIVASDQPAPPAVAAAASAAGLKLARSVSFPSMARADEAQGGAARLVAVKAVSAGYPLRGSLQIADQPGSGAREVRDAPAAGTVWVDAAVLDSLALKIGDPLLLGDATLRIAAVITVEPDRGAGFMSFAPRVMLAESDLAATALVQPASRVTFRSAVAAVEDNARGAAAVRDFVATVKTQSEREAWRGVRVESLESGRPEMTQTLARAERFLNLVALLSALLAAVAVAIAARDYAQRRLDDCAMLRVLGQSQRRIAWAYALEFIAVGLLASVLGVLLGLAVHGVFVALLAGLVSATLPAPSAWPALLGLGVGLTLLVGFGLPPVLQLASVPPLRVIRRDLGELKATSLVVLALGGVGFCALLLAVSSDVKLGAITVGGFALALGVFALVGWGAVKLLRRLVPDASTPRWWTLGASAPRWLVLATRQVAARPGYAVLQISSLSVGLLALVLLVLLRTDLVDSWRAATPPDAPNRFVINIQPEQGEAFQRQLRGAGVERFDWYPMIRGRLVAVNGKPVKPEDFAEGRAQRLVEREFNLSHAAQPPEHNVITAGQWVPEDPDALSVEEGLARDLGLKLGDELTFDMAGLQQSGRIANLRKVDWGSMRVNFFVMFQRAQMPDLPATTIAAFRAPPAAGAAFDGDLSRAFPNITNVDISASIAQVQGVLDQVIRAVEFLFGFTLAAGLVVLFAAVTATREQRAREYAVMRALGASGALLGRVQRAELLGVGLLAGVLASTAAVAVGWALARYVFEFNWTASPWVPLAGGAAGALLALAAGWWGLREVLTRPVMETLRRAAE